MSSDGFSSANTGHLEDVDKDRLSGCGQEPMPSGRVGSRPGTEPARNGTTVGNPEMPPDLAEIAAAWEALPPHIRETLRRVVAVESRPAAVAGRHGTS